MKLRTGTQQYQQDSSDEKQPAAVASARNAAATTTPTTKKKATRAAVLSWVSPMVTNSRVQELRSRQPLQKKRSVARTRITGTRTVVSPYIMLNSCFLLPSLFIVDPYRTLIVPLYNPYRTLIVDYRTLLSSNPESWVSGHRRRPRGPSPSLGAGRLPSLPWDFCARAAEGECIYWRPKSYRGFKGCL